MHCVVCALCGVCIVCFSFENSLCGVCIVCFSSQYAVFFFGNHHFQRNPMELHRSPPSLIAALNIECHGMEPSQKFRLRPIMGPRRHWATHWETPTHVVEAIHSVPSPSLFDVLSDTLGHDGPEAQSHSASPREADSMSQRAQSPAAQSPAAQWLNASLKAHPGSCHPCWFTAKGSGCQREGCLFCHKPHVPADVRHPGGRLRQRVAKRNGRDHSRV